MNNDKKENKKNNPVSEKAKPASPPAGEAASEAVILKKEEYEGLLSDGKKAAEYLDHMKRLQAEFDNAKKRLERDRFEYIKHAKEDVIAELLGIVDNFRRADEAALKTKDFNLLQEGVVMILKEIKALFERNGVREIPALGEAFDPLKHEAVDFVITDEFPENTVVEELQKGYFINGKIIRHSVVKISKKKVENSV